MPSRLSNLVDNLSEINKDCKTSMEKKKLNSNVNLLGLKIIDQITDGKNAMEYLLNQ